MKRVEIDSHSGFCFGVVRAIEIAQKELQSEQSLCCLGDIVHNNQEVMRLEKLGLRTISICDLPNLNGKKVLLRAHGEPPKTYQIAQENNIQIIDATCPVVLKLQQRIKNRFIQNPNEQIVIFGKKGHAEVIGLQGQTNQTAIVVESDDDITKIDPSKNVALFSQTTKSIDQYNQLAEKIKGYLHEGVQFVWFDTICRQVANRTEQIRHFAAQYDVIIFVSGAKSSNGKILFLECEKINKNSHLVTSPDEVDSQWFETAQSVGICGATSTPVWLMEKIKDKINRYEL